MSALTLNDRYVSLSPAANTTVLNGDFQILREDGLAVRRTRGTVITDLAFGIDYVFPLGLGTEAGFSLQLAMPSLAGDQYELFGATPPERLSDFKGNAKFSADKFDADIHYLTIVQQEQGRDIDRAAKLPFGEDGITIYPGTAGQVASFTGAGDLEGRDPSVFSPSTILPTAFMAAAVQGWGDAAAARTGLGAGATGDAVLTASTTAAALLAIGAFAAFPSLYASRTAAMAATIPAPVEHILTAGDAAAGDWGHAQWRRVGSAPAHPGKFQDASGAWFELVATGGMVNPRQLRAKGDGVTDDGTKLQDWIDTANALKVKAVAMGGTYATTIQLNTHTGLDIEGTNGATIHMNSHAIQAAIKGLTKSDCAVRGLTFTTIAFTTSVTSMTIGAATFNLTVATGLPYVAAEPLMLIANAAVGDGQNYMIGTVNSYVSGTGALQVTVAGGAFSGSGTFANWIVVRNNGLTCAVELDGCTNGRIENCHANGRFYVGFRTFNGKSDRILNNLATGVINRAFYCFSASGSSDDCQIRGNRVLGGGITQYGINANGSIAGSIKNLAANDNNVNACVFQGIEIGGSCFDCTADQNTVDVLYAAGGCAVLIQRANGAQPQRCSARGNKASGAAYGVRSVDTLFTQILGNTITTATVAAISCEQINSTHLYGTVSGNQVNGGVDGIVFNAATASQCGQTSITSNSVIGASGTGYKSNANCDRIVLTGNVGMANGTNENMLGTNIDKIAGANRFG